MTMPLHYRSRSCSTKPEPAGIQWTMDTLQPTLMCSCFNRYGTTSNQLTFSILLGDDVKAGLPDEPSILDADFTQVLLCARRQSSDVQGGHEIDGHWFQPCSLTTGYGVQLHRKGWTAWLARFNCEGQREGHSHSRTRVGVQSEKEK